MADERLQILRMLEEGKVTAEEAAQLLEVMQKPTASSVGAAEGGRRNRFLRVRITEGDRTKVNVNVPLALARMALNLAPRFLPDDVMQKKGVADALDFDEIGRLLEEGLEGKIVDVEDEEADTRVEVLVE